MSGAGRRCRAWEIWVNSSQSFGRGGLAPFLAIAIVRTVSLPGHFQQGGPAAGCFKPVQAGSIPNKNAQQSVIIFRSLGHAHASRGKRKLMAFDDIRDDSSIADEQPQDTGLPTDNKQH